jgi:D-alanyl-D-alanine dipeptidase
MNLFNYRLADFAKKPIPDLTVLRFSRWTWEIPIDNKHPKHQEKLVDLTSNGIKGENYYGKMNNPPVPDSTKLLLVRESVLTLLMVVDCFLWRQNSSGIFVKDAWRPVTVQKYIYERYLNKLRLGNPSLKEEALLDLIRGVFTKVPEGEGLQKAPPPHCTGGAVDLVLINSQDRAFPEMGQGTAKGQNYPDFYERKNNLSADQEMARKNRRLLYWPMFYAGFATNPTEFWHYSYGDQMEAEFSRVVLGSKDEEAVYGLIQA